MRKYTTKQIEESIAHWKSVLASMSESKKIRSTRVMRDFMAGDGTWRIDVDIDKDSGDGFTRQSYTGFETEDAAKRYEKKLLGGLTEASYGGEHGVSDPALEPPTQEQLCKSMVNASDDSNAEMLISVLNEIGLNDNLKKILLNLDDQDILTDFARTLVASMSAEDYKKYVQIMF